MQFCLNLLLPLLFSLQVFADVERLVPLDKSYIVSDKHPKHEILDMPPDSSQDTLGICFAEVAAKMMQKENCEYLKKQRPDDKILCAEMTERQLFAPLDVARMQIKPGETAPALRYQYNSVHVYGGNLVDAVKFAALVVRKTANTACVSLDRILAKTNSRADAEKIQVALWQKLEKDFEKIKSGAEKLNGCEDCLTKFYQTAAQEFEPFMDRELNLRKDKFNLAEALAAKTYAEFLNHILGTEKCERPTELVRFEPYEKVRYVAFPNSPGEQTDKATVFRKIKSVLTEGRPVALNGICYDDMAICQREQKKFHAVVVTGYRTVCNPQGKCKESIKVVNSKGKSWQDANDQGWIDANTLLDNTLMGAGILSWFEDRQ